MSSAGRCGRKHIMVDSTPSSKRWGMCLRIAKTVHHAYQRSYVTARIFTYAFRYLLYDKVSKYAFHQRAPLQVLPSLLEDSLPSIMSSINREGRQ